MSKQIKSKKRVKDFAEVFTAEREVKAMCDLIPFEQWTIESKFLEPSCGTGNFLVEIYSRKLKLCKNEKDGLKALASIVGIDIQADNCEESRERLFKMYLDNFPEASNFAVVMANLILQNNIICGDSLKIMEQWEKENEKQTQLKGELNEKNIKMP
jgi:SAM-dependent methyltransferase